MDNIDQALVESASKHMIQFDIIEFKINNPSLYATIRETVSYVSEKSNQQREVAYEDF